MKIGIPREVKTLEGRVALIPEAAAELVRSDFDVYIETGAGLLSGYLDSDYQSRGIKVVESAAALYDMAELIVKVKEPQPQEFELLKPEHLLFCYLHLAAESELMSALIDKGLTAIGFETVADGHYLPLLAPMSDIAGKVAIQVGTHLLHQPQGGRGVLLGGVAASERGKVVVLGGGVAGSSAAKLAAALGARVTVFEHTRPKMEAMRDIGANVTSLFSYEHSIADALETADLLIGAVLIPGARTPHLVSREMVKKMPTGSVIIDISVDQGGCVETIRPTTYDNPTYVEEDVVHFGVTNMPGAVPRTSSQALSAAILPYVHFLATPDWRQNAPLVNGINVEGGNVIHPALREL